MLLGSKIGLRPLQGDDVWVLYRWFNDPRVRDALGSQHDLFPVSMDEEKKRVEEDINASDRKAFIIVKLEDNNPIGLILLTDIDPRNATAQLNITIGEVDQWDKGYGRDSIQVLLKYAFQMLNLHRIWLRVAEYNEKAIRCYLASGFQKEGRMRDDHYHGGRYRDMFLMSILSEEFKC